jgi:ABC-2 type transport system permease protein
MGIAMPMILLFLFGYALTLDVDRVPLVVWDQSGSSTSRDLLSRFQGSRYFSVKGYVRTYRDLEHAIDTSQALVALVIPTDFASRVESGRPVSIQVIVDGSDPSTATLAATYAEGIVQSYSQGMSLENFQRIGTRPSPPPLEVRVRAWYNEDMQFRNYLVPGLIAVIMMIIAALLTSLTVAREWEGGTMEQLIATPVQGSELILGKLVPYFVIGMLDVTGAVVMGEFLFHVPMRGSLALLFGMAAVFLVGTLSVGLLVSIVTKSQMLATQIAMVLTFVPAFLLSGLMFSISIMPGPLQAVTLFIPARYFVTFLRGVYMKGVGLHVLAIEAFLLVMFSVAMALLANARFKKRLV